MTYRVVFRVGENCAAFEQRDLLVLVDRISYTLTKRKRKRSAQSKVGGSTRKYARPNIRVGRKRKAGQGQRRACREERSGK